MHAELSHHLRRLGLVLVRLHLPLNLVRMEVSCLIGLCEGVMVRDARSIVTEAAEVALGSLLFLDGDGHDFDLIIGESDLNFKLVWHHELIRFNRVIVILLLFSDLIAFFSHHLLLHLLLLELL